MKVLFDKKNLGLAAYSIKYVRYYYASSKNKLVFILYYMQFLMYYIHEHWFDSTQKILCHEKLNDENSLGAGLKKNHVS